MADEDLPGTDPELFDDTLLTADGTPSGSALIEWDPVNVTDAEEIVYVDDGDYEAPDIDPDIINGDEDDDGDVPAFFDLDLVQYQVFLRAPGSEVDDLVTTTPNTSYLFTGLAPGDYSATVVAVQGESVSAAAESFGFTIGGELFAEGDLVVDPVVAPAAPTNPVVTSELGTVLLEWDGLLVDGLPSPSFSRIEYEIASAEAGPYTRAGATARVAGQAPLGGLTVGTMYWFRSVAVSAQGLESDPTDPVFVTVAAVPKTALDDALQIELSDAAGQVTNETYVPDLSDGAGKPEGALWYVYSGTDVVGAYKWDGFAWDQFELTNAVLGSLSVSKLTAGNLFANTLLAAYFSTHAAADEGIKFGTNGVDTGLVAYNPTTHAKTFELDANTGNVTTINVTAGTITGATLRTAATGTRVEIASSGAYQSQVSFFSNAVTDPFVGYIRATTSVLNPSDTAIAMLGTKNASVQVTETTPTGGSTNPFLAMSKSAAGSYSQSQLTSDFSTISAWRNLSVTGPYDTTGNRLNDTTPNSLAISASVAQLSGGAVRLQTAVWNEPAHTSTRFGGVTVSRITNEKVGVEITADEFYHYGPKASFITTDGTLKSVDILNGGITTSAAVSVGAGLTTVGNVAVNGGYASGGVSLLASGGVFAAGSLTSVGYTTGGSANVNMTSGGQIRMASSLRALKTDIADVEPGDEILTVLRPRRFRWKDEVTQYEALGGYSPVVPPRTVIGLIAEEVLEADPTGTLNTWVGGRLQGVNWEAITGMTLKTTIDHARRIPQLEQEIAELRQLINA